MRIGFWSGWLGNSLSERPMGSDSVSSSFMIPAHRTIPIGTVNVRYIVNHVVSPKVSPSPFTGAT